jgi:hypothetical protein
MSLAESTFPKLPSQQTILIDPEFCREHFQKLEEEHRRLHEEAALGLKLENGDLAYAGQKVDPKTFSTEDIDFRKLVGKCQRCGKIVRGIHADPHPDPYAADINDDSTPVVQCVLCDHESAQDV